MPSAFSFTQAEIDDVLLVGSNTTHAREHIVDAFQKQKTMVEIAELLKHEFHGGYGIKGMHGDYAAWYAEDGIHLHKGRSARYESGSQVISWESAAESIGQLLESGSFSTNVEIAEASGLVRSETALSLLYLYHDLSEDARSQGYLSCLDDLPAGYPDAQTALAEHLTDKEFLSELRGEYAMFYGAYAEDRGLLRFHYHKPDELWKKLSEVDLERIEYTSSFSEMPEHIAFITDDEIDAALAGGSSVEGGKGRIYSYFTENHSTKDKAEFLKNEYGIGGHSHAVSGSDHSGEDHSARGMKLQKAGCADVELNWMRVAECITALIRKDRYLTSEQKEQLAKRQQEAELSKYDLGYGAMGNGLTVWNRKEQEHGDYKTVAHIDADRSVTFYDDNLPDAIRERIQEVARTAELTVSETQDTPVFHEQAEDAPVQSVEHNAEVEHIAPAVEKPVTSEEIQQALIRWNGSFESKSAVQDYMTVHGRERGTAQWLKDAYGGGDTFNVVTDHGTLELPWSRTQRNLWILVNEGRFLTEADRMLAQAEQIAAQSEEINAGQDDAGTVSAEPETISETESVSQIQSNDELLGVELTMDGRRFVVDGIHDNTASLRDVTFQNGIGFPIFRNESVDRVRGILYPEQTVVPTVNLEATVTTAQLELLRPQLDEAGIDYLVVSSGFNSRTISFSSEHYQAVQDMLDVLPDEPEYTTEQEAVYPSEHTGLPYDIVVERIRTEPEHTPPAQNFHITDEHLGEGGAKAKFRIHEANTEARKKDLFAKVRSGQVRVLMGSTFKMGAGMNVQDRLIALHDLDAPWRPGDLEQRSGRIIRQGNQNKEVHIYRYVTEATFDAYLWQTLENKQKFISQIMTSKSPVRSCEDIDETALSYAEIKALCAGDDRIREKMDLDVDVARLKLMKANHQSQQYRLEDNILRTFPQQIEQNMGYIAGFQADMATLAEHPHPQDGFAGMTVRGDNLIDKENAGAALLDAMKEVKGLEPVPIGSYRGFQMSLTLEDFGKQYILTLKGKISHRVELGKDARGNLIRIDNALSNMESRLARVQEKLDNLHAQMETAKAELGKPFPQEQELKEKSARLAQLNVELNIDDKTPIEAMIDASEPAQDTRPAVTAKSERTSVLAKLRAPLPQRDNHTKPENEKEER